MSPIDFQTHGACAVITIDRPQARNAISPEVAQGLEAAIDRLEADDALRIGILTGTPPVFCAGADLKAVGAGRGKELSTERGGFGGLVRRTRAKPLIAAVDGAALAGGLELVLACDLVVASSVASFGTPEVRRGLLAAGGALLRLPDRLPRNLAMELVLTGAPIDAQTAHHHGLVNRLCAPGEALDAALALAGEIAANGPLAVRLAREVLLEACDGDTTAFWASNDAANERIMASEDVKEGVLAFVEKRPALFMGR
ncbi:MAG: paaG [Solirubrobacterales bacterium]|jgi:enoyl-CoA hydratase|nr:paaG [Solirubrobacterales bacterium]